MPLVFYLGTESLRVPIDSCTTAPHVCSETKIEKHVACGYDFAVVEYGKDKIVSKRIKRAPNCLEYLIIELGKTCQSKLQQDANVPNHPYKKNQSISVGYVKHPSRTIEKKFWITVTRAVSFWIGLILIVT